MFDVEKIRQDFPMIRNNPELIYFDNGATTYKPDRVIEAMNGFYQKFTSNVERGDYRTAVQADQAYARTREIIARLINCLPDEVAFSANITAALNQAAYGLDRMFLEKDDKVLLTQAEHASNLLPWFRIKRDKGIRIEYIPLDDQGNIDIDGFKRLLDPRTKIVSLAFQTNVLGSLQPLAEICKLAHDNGTIVVVDAAQAIGHRPIDVRELDCDILCFSAHKMCGPDGVGVMYGRYDLIKDMEPLLLGGGMNARFDNEGNIIYKNAPERFEAGTPNIEGVIGLGAAAEYLMDIGLAEIESYERQLRAYLLEKLIRLDNLVIYNPDNLNGPIAFNVKGVFAQDAAGYLAAHDIAVRSGNHCAKILKNIIGEDQTLRASLYFYNTQKEADRFAEECSRITLESAIDAFI